jgi:hypothetical protein
MQSTWTIRKNSSAKIWYEHRPSGYKTWVTPMTAVCGLPPGWRQLRDPEGNTYFQHIATGETSRTRPGNLPLGWAESKDPDGKLFFVNQELQLASWCRPGQQPDISTSSSAIKSTAIHASQPVVHATSGPSMATIPAPTNVRPISVAVVPQKQRSISSSQPSQQQVSLATATEATINLLDPTNGGIVRNTKIVSHIAGQGVKGTVKAVTHNQRLQTFARGTGLATANKKVKNAWRKAAQEVALIDNHRRGSRVMSLGTQSQTTAPKSAVANDGEYVIEYEDGTIEYYDASEKLLRTSTVGTQHPQQNSNLAQRPSIQQRPPLQIQQVSAQQSQGQYQVQSHPGQTSHSQIQHIQMQQAQVQQGYPQQGQIQQAQPVQIQTLPARLPQPQVHQFQVQHQAQQSQAQSPQSPPQQTQILQAQQLQHQPLVSRPASQTHHYAQHESTLLGQAVSAFQHSIQHPHHSSPQHYQQHTVHTDQTPAEAVNTDQAQAVYADPTTYLDQQTLYPNQTVYVDQTQTQTQVVYTDQAAQNYTIDSTAADVNIDVNIDQNVYIDQNCTIQDQTFTAGGDGASIDVQNIETVDGGSYEVDVEVDVDVDVDVEVESVDCGSYDEVGFDF